MVPFFFSLSHPSPWGDFVREPFPLSATEKFFQESSGHWLPFHFSGPSELKGKHTATLNSFLLCGRIHHPFIGGSIPAENDDVTQKSVSLLQVVALFCSGWPFFFTKIQMTGSKKVAQSRPFVGQTECTRLLTVVTER